MQLLLITGFSLASKNECMAPDRYKKKSDVFTALTRIGQDYFPRTFKNMM